jgi:hypothetical protein
VRQATTTAKNFRQAAASAAAIRVTVTPTDSGRKWRAVVAGKALCVAAAPLVHSARILLANGRDPSATLELWHQRAECWALRGRLGAVAATPLEGERRASRRATNRVAVRFPAKSRPQGPKRAIRRFVEVKQ